MEIKQKLIPKSNKRTRPGIAMKPSWITVHETDNVNKGADAEAHARLQYNGNSRTASWHYTVDEREIWQSIPDNEVAWACGDGSNGTGNRKSISIEICVNQDGNYEKAKQNAIWLIQHLMKKHSIPIGRVVTHKKWSGKNCPRKLLPHWNAFVNQIKGVSKPSAPKYPGIPLRRNSRGGNVKLVQRKLGGLAVDGIFGPKTEAAVKKFQKAKKIAVDGIVGSITWNALFG